MKQTITTISLAVFVSSLFAIGVAFKGPGGGRRCIVPSVQAKDDDDDRDRCPGNCLYPVRLAAQEQQEQRKKEQRRYSVTDLGTLGGNNSIPQGINNRGQVVGLAETADIDPNCGCLVFHAFLWNKGILHDLGTLGGRRSEAGLGGVNREGQVVGDSETSVVDPNNPPFLEYRAFLWQKGVMTDLGTLGGNDSFAIAIDSEHQVVGGAQTGEPDPFFGQQFHPFLWEKGVMKDLGTLGGSSGFAAGINTVEEDQESPTKTEGNQIQVVGGASVNSTPVPPFTVPPFFAFLWEKGVMTNLGALGGIESLAFAINDRSQVAGEFTFVDSDGTGISHAFRWEGGLMQDFGTVMGDQASIAYAINHKGQVVGGSGSGFIDAFSTVHAFLWENGVLSDLNTLIPTNAGLQLIVAFGINARGQIVALAFESSTGNVHAVLLTPDHSTSTNQGTASAAPAETAGRPPVILSENVRNLLQMAIPGSVKFKARLNQK
jgi:probable HAF family extracellular repeat protein